MKTAKGLKYAGFGVLGVAAVFLFTYLVMLLWNALVPELFNGPVLSYWQTMGVFILAKILFSGMGSSGHKGERSSHVRKYRSHEDFPRSKWRQKFEAKMNGKVEMSSDEDREDTVEDPEK